MSPEGWLPDFGWSVKRNSIRRQFIVIQFVRARDDSIGLWFVYFTECVFFVPPRLLSFAVLCTFSRRTFDYYPHAH